MFGDEAGDLTSKPHFVLGIVKVENRLAQQLEMDLENICELHGHLGEIKSSSTYAKTHAIRISFISHFVETRGVEFRCLVVNNVDFDIRYFANNHLGLPRQDIAYNFLYRQVLQSNCRQHDRVIAYLDDKSRSRNDNLFEYLVREVPNIADAQPRDSKSSRILQLADVLSGVVYNEISGGTQRTKLAAREFALNSLGISSFRGRGAGPKFNVWHWKSRNAQRSPDSRRK